MWEGQKLTFSNKNLPNSIHKKDWHKTFIPMFLLWVGRQANPWNIADDKLINVLQKI
jgi:hypothetical protein